MSELPIVDACFVSSIPGKGYVMAREASEPVEAARCFPIARMIDALGDDTDQADEARVVIFGADGFGWCTYELQDAEAATLQ
ncbi:MAG: hypothetical protein ACM3W4_02115 [Ignavibacteriales bacterium]